MGHSFLSSALIGSALLCAPLGAQMAGGEWNERRVFSEPIHDGAYFGYALHGGADFNQDGIPDQIVSAPSFNPGGMSDAGAVYVYSGADGSILHHFVGAYQQQALGWSVAAADLNGDGVPDILAGCSDIGTANNGRVYAWSGVTGAVLYEITVSFDTHFGESIEVIPDQDGDQIPDLLIGASDTYVNSDPFVGTVDLRSGADGTFLHRWFGSNAYDNYGASVTLLGDVNGDGVGEFAFGIPGYDVSFREGAVTVIDGATYQELRTFSILAHGSNQQLGAAVANPGDVNGDGIEDLLVGATGDANYQGRAYILDGASQFLNVVYDLPGRFSSDFFGESVSAAGDVDQDGFADFLVGASVSGSGAAGYVELYSGRDGSLLQEWLGDPDEHLGMVALAGDTNGDGAQEILLGGYIGSHPGVAKMVGLDAYLNLGAQELSATPGTPVSYELDFPASEAGRAFSLLLSLAGGGNTTVGGLEIPLADDPILQAMLMGVRPPILSPTRGLLDAQGDAQGALFGVPALSSLIGRRLMICAVTFDPVAQTGYLSSASRSVVIVP